ncbi:MAG: 50S ribosomal protein L30 [Cyanobacteria bacterium]|nr:50S ribosomal protein L30 [Cyanobacteriota bacterium]MDA1020945.1 50S ribosomal protein L30 [Cyanobacteriota bacterium]
MATETKKLSIKLVRGICKADKHQTKILNALGIRKSKQVVHHHNGPTILGMLDRVAHLVEVTNN